MYMYIAHYLNFWSKHIWHNLNRTQRGVSMLDTCEQIMFPLTFTFLQIHILTIEKSWSKLSSIWAFSPTYSRIINWRELDLNFLPFRQPCISQIHVLTSLIKPIKNREEWTKVFFPLVQKIEKSSIRSPLHVSSFFFSQF